MTKMKYYQPHDSSVNLLMNAQVLMKKVVDFLYMYAQLTSIS